MYKFCSSNLNYTESLGKCVLKEMDFESDDKVIIGGDFNCPLGPVKDKKGGNSTSTSNQFD